MNAIQQKQTRAPVSFKCGAPHYMRDCSILVCRYCGQNPKHADCTKSGQKTFCVKCKSKYHNIQGHYKYAPEGQKLHNPEINVIKATSFLEGAVSMDMDSTGNHFEDTKILIDTGALIPTGVAISEYFFINNLQGKVGDLVSSDLNSANGAS